MATVTEYGLRGSLEPAEKLTEPRAAPADTIKTETTSSEIDVTQKRKASPDSFEGEDTSKRPKIEERDPPTQDSALSTDSRPRDQGADTNAPRRAPLSKDEEKKRGKRLFGGLLSTLSQTNASSQHKKRREIEQRQHERAQKQRAEDDKRRTEKLARITEARWREQIKLDEKAMKTRHVNMLAMAHSLRSKAKPPVYYRPWKLTSEQEDRIDGQIEDAKVVIAREVEAFRGRKEEHGRRYGQNSPARDEVSADEVSAPVVIDDAAKANTEPLVEAPTHAPTVANEVPSSHHQHDEPGDVVEDAEDMVIY
ncbi:Pinin-like protein 1 [Colletotrichum shisoi]|uniref:Pinin-like protein 1 n=1 Tax=Colletotrichum shisoi TaxID=2078593 RepID=A0A5Q4C3U9_9PEZI|nr:Pinin-like protein 1 [Colletotrichum shisoi]